MEAFINSTLAVALGEMGDKTQVLALLLAARYRRPWPILIGIFLALLLWMAATAWLGTLVSHLLTPEVLYWLLVIMFFAVALWTLMPEKGGEDDEALLKSFHSLLLTAFVTFLLAEMGDKSQAATFVLAATYQDVAIVSTGATIGGMLAIVPAVFFGKTTAHWLPVKSVRITAAAVFAALGCWIMFFGID
jgi:putative Ca2+/H+ antiporter (TMEM165/GDT1 family)